MSALKAKRRAIGGLADRRRREASYVGEAPGDFGGGGYAVFDGLVKPDACACRSRNRFVLKERPMRRCPGKPSFEWWRGVREAAKLPRKRASIRRRRHYTVPSRPKGCIHRKRRRRPQRVSSCRPVSENVAVIEEVVTISDSREAHFERNSEILRERREKSRAV